MNEQNDMKRPLLPPVLPPWWRVLPSLVLFIVIVTIDSLVLNDFIEHRYAIRYQQNSSSTQNTRELCLNASGTLHSSSDSIFTTTSNYPVSTTMSPEDLIQSSTARLNVYIALAATIPSVLTSILLGTNCDRIGRKPLIVLPYIGKIVRYSILIAAAYYDLSDLWIIVAVMFDGLFGTSGLTLLSSFAYVSDCTNEKTRTSAIIITDVCMVGSRFVPLLTMGIYLQHPKFVQSMIFTFLLSLTGFVFSIALQPESNLNVQHLNLLQKLAQTKIREITKIFRVFLVKREGHKQRSLLILTGAHLCVIMVIYGSGSIQYLYLYGVPFCFDSLRVSLTSVVQTVSMILLTIPCTLTVTKRTDHLALPIVGFLAYITQLVLFGVTNQVWMIFLAVCIGSLFFVLIPVVRSRITKLVEPSEYAVVFILALICESGGSYAIDAMANEIYRVSFTFYSGLVYFVYALVSAFGILLLLILHALESRPPAVQKTSVLND